MATNSSAKPKEIVPREKKHYLYDMVKSDGQFKEMIGMQELARDTWADRWQFMNRQHILEIYQEQAAKLNLPLDFMTNRRRKKAFEREYSGKQTLVDSAPMPTLSSGRIKLRNKLDKASQYTHSLQFKNLTTAIPIKWNLVYPNPDNLH